jgi:hypothetical protein
MRQFYQSVVDHSTGLGCPVTYSTLQRTVLGSTDGIGTAQLVRNWVQIGLFQPLIAIHGPSSIAAI